MSAEGGRDDIEILYYRLASSPLDTDGSDTREYYVAFRDDKVVSYGERTDELTKLRSAQQYNSARSAAAELTRSLNNPQPTAITPTDSSPDFLGTRFGKPDSALGDSFHAAQDDSTYLLKQPTGSTYQDGYKSGYLAGFKYGKPFGISPIPPTAPIPFLGAKTFQDGYNRGFIDGRNAQDK
jgi:hypothetical protein